jgi:hypothetical protein
MRLTVTALRSAMTARPERRGCGAWSRTCRSPGIAALLALAVLGTSGPARAHPFAPGLVREAAEGFASTAARGSGAQPTGTPAGTSADDTAAASSPSSEAEQSFRAGSEAYALGDFAGAVAAFERSYQLSQRPELLFNLGQAYARWFELSEDPAHLRKAKSLLKNYVSFLEDQSPVDDAAVADANGRIAAIDGQLERLGGGSASDAAGQSDAGDDEAKRRKRAVALGVGIGVGVLAVVAGVVAGVLLARGNDDGFDPELGTLRRGASPMGTPGGAGRTPALLRF